MNTNPAGHCRHCGGQFKNRAGLLTHKASCIPAQGAASQFASSVAWPMDCTAGAVVVAVPPLHAAGDDSGGSPDSMLCAGDADDDLLDSVLKVHGLKSPGQFEAGDWDVMLATWMKDACGGSGLSNVDVNDLFALLKQPGFVVNDLTYKNAKTFNDYVRKLPSQEWVTETFTWKLRKEGQAKLEYTLVKKVDLVGFLQKVIDTHSGGKGWEWGYKETQYADGTRYVDRPTSGDWYKAMSVRFPGKCILGLGNYTDKSALNNKGSHVGYPEITVLLNGDMECIREQYRTGLIAQLPALSRPKGVKPADWPKFKKIILADLLANIFEKLVTEINRRPDKVIIFRDTNGDDKECVIGLHSHPCDLEEHLVIAGNVKTTCALCLGDKNSFCGYIAEADANFKKENVADCVLVQYTNAPPRTLKALSEALQAWDNSKTPAEKSAARDECERLGMCTEGATIDEGDRKNLISKYLIGFARVHPDCWKGGPLNIFSAMHPCTLHGVWLGTWINLVEAIPKLAEWTGFELMDLLEKSPDVLRAFKAKRLEWRASERSVEELLTHQMSDALVSVASLSRWESFTVPIPSSYLSEVTKSGVKGKTGRKLNGREHKSVAQVLWAAVRGIATRCRVNIPEVDAIFKTFEDRTLTMLVLFMDVQALNGRKNMPPGHTLASIQALQKKYHIFLHFLSFGVPRDIQTSQFCTPKAHMFSHFQQLLRSGCSDITSTDMGEAAQQISTKWSYLGGPRRTDTVQYDIAKNFEENLAIDAERVRRNLPEDCRTHDHYKVILRQAELSQTSVLGEIRCAVLTLSNLNVNHLGVLPAKVTKALNYLCPTAMVAIGKHFKESVEAHLSRMLPRRRARGDAFDAVDHSRLGIIPCQHGIIFGAYLKHVPAAVVTRPNMRIHAAGRYYGVVRHDMVFLQRDVPTQRTATTDYARLIFLFNTKEKVDGAEEPVKNSFAFVQIHSCVNTNVLPTCSWPEYESSSTFPLPTINVSLLCAEDRYEVVPLLWLFRAVAVVPDMSKDFGVMDDAKDSGDGLFARKYWIENPFKWNQERRWNL